MYTLYIWMHQFSACVYNQLSFVFPNVFQQKFLVLVFGGKICKVKFVRQNIFFYLELQKFFNFFFNYQFRVF